MPLSKSEISKRIHEEHDKLREEFQKIYQKIDAHVPAEQFPRWRMDLIFLLRDFQNDLLKHFDLEEEGGFMSDVIRLAPQHSGVVAKLQAEHIEIARELDNILIYLKGLQENTSGKYADFSRRVKDLLNFFRAHETTESEVLMSTYLQDEGGGD